LLAVERKSGAVKNNLFGQTQRIFKDESCPALPHALGSLIYQRFLRVRNTQIYGCGGTHGILLFLGRVYMDAQLVNTMYIPSSFLADSNQAGMIYK